MTIKLLLVSVEGTIAAGGKMRNDIAQELATLAKELHDQGVTVALWSNKRWMVDGTTPLHQHISNLSGVPIRIHGLQNDQSPARKKKNSAAPVLAAYGASLHETVLVGGMQDDMIAGVNNGLLLIRPNWYGVNIEYGFPVESVSELRRFLLLFALRKHPIFWRIQAGSLDASAGGPFSTHIRDYAEFGRSAREAAKHGMGRKDFWFYLIVASIYFGKLIQDVQLICTYPGHGTGAPNPVKQELNEVLTRLGRCFNKPYFHDLIARHANAPKSQSISAASRTFLAQLNTIHLNPHPKKNLGAAVRGPVKLKGKRILLVDDFCTSGKSLEAARAYIEAVGATALTFCWLKTINTPYMQMAPLPAFNPFQAQSFAQEPHSTPHRYGDGIVAAAAPVEIAAVYRDFLRWR